MACCDKFEEAIQDNEFVEISCGDYYIRGKPDIVYEGDGYTCDMTGSKEIFHCPFCGKLLK